MLKSEFVAFLKCISKCVNGGEDCYRCSSEFHVPQADCFAADFMDEYRKQVMDLAVALEHEKGEPTKEVDPKELLPHLEEG